MLKMSDEIKKVAENGRTFVVVLIDESREQLLFCPYIFHIIDFRGIFT